MTDERKQLLRPHAFEELGDFSRWFKGFIRLPEPCKPNGKTVGGSGGPSPFSSSRTICRNEGSNNCSNAEWLVLPIRSQIRMVCFGSGIGQKSGNILRLGHGQVPAKAQPGFNPRPHRPVDFEPRRIETHANLSIASFRVCGHPPVVILTRTPGSHHRTDRAVWTMEQHPRP